MTDSNNNNNNNNTTDSTSTFTTDKRIYNTILEISFDIERLLNIHVRSVFYHFHKSSYNNKNISPYLIMYIDNDNVKHTLIFHDIINTFHYIPIYTIGNNIITDFGYVDINNKLYTVSKNNTIYNSLIDYYSQSNVDMISTNVINDVKYNITDAGFEFTEDTGFIHIPAIDTHISKHKHITKSDHDKYTNIISPIEMISLDHIMCIGTYRKNNNSLDDCNYALIIACNKCDNAVMCNYSSGKYVCHHCNHIGCI